MEKTIEQVEKNVSASFGYVKKDMLMLNDAFSDIHDKLQKVSRDVEDLRKELAKKKETKTQASKKATKKVAKKK